MSITIFSALGPRTSCPAVPPAGMDAQLRWMLAPGRGAGEVTEEYEPILENIAAKLDAMARAAA